MNTKRKNVINQNGGCERGESGHKQDRIHIYNDIRGWDAWDRGGVGSTSRHDVPRAAPSVWPVTPRSPWQHCTTGGRGLGFRV
jgi:hypothetical protein